MGNQQSVYIPQTGAVYALAADDDYVRAVGEGRWGFGEGQKNVFGAGCGYHGESQPREGVIEIDAAV